MSNVSERSNPFDLSSTTLTNIVIGNQIDRDNFISRRFLERRRSISRIQNVTTSKKQKTVKLFDPISKTRKNKKIKEVSKKFDVKKETIKALHIMDYARLRNFDICNLLSYELTSIPFYLANEYGFLNKSTSQSLHEKFKINYYNLFFHTFQRMTKVV